MKSISKLVVVFWLSFSLLPIDHAQSAVVSKRFADVSPQLQVRLTAAYQSKGKDYQPRTEHLHADGSPKYINRLILEQSPYLLQHAHNPVNWYAWDKEAFAKAKRENKPIFLSIGYSTCHWCHVMERESFDNEAIAEYLNKHFVAIKVDRERRPDVDKTYMTAVMLINGSGGWPMSSILTPEGEPFFAGTYFPPNIFLQVLQKSTQLWQKEETEIRKIANRVATAVQNRQQGMKLAERIDREVVENAVNRILANFDELQGGFSQAPKFPNETYLFLLLDNLIREPNPDTFYAVQLTLDMMAQGGIYDQVGGGFHRYAVDNEWLVPHFEKMLYNQAHLARIYLQFYALTHNPAYARVVTQTLDYVLKEMQAKTGGFYSASDADSDGEEGKHFLWTFEQLQQVLEPEQAKLALALFAVSKEGNFTEHPEAGNSGNNILSLKVSLAEYAKTNTIPLEQLHQDVDQLRDRLYQQRQTRIAPAIDQKIVTAWNGMLITALAQAGQQLENPDYVQGAVKAAEYLWRVHRFADAKDTGLWRASLDGKPSVPATQADYAYLAQGFLALYDVTGDRQWLERSKQLGKDMIRLFWDTEQGGFFLSIADQEVPLFDRPRDIFDGAIPSANAVALEVLSQLYYRTGDDSYHDQATALLASLSGLIKTAPESFAYLLMAANQLNFGELAYADIGTPQYGGKGHVRIEHQVLSRKRLDKDRQQLELDIGISIDNGWHINSRYPLDKDLVATSVSLDNKRAQHWKITRVEYPAGEQVQLKFNDKPLSLYQGKVTLKVLLASAAPSAQQNKGKNMFTVPLQINYQSCSDTICLAPQTATIYLIPQETTGN